MVNDTERAELRETIHHNQHEVYILSVEEMSHVIDTHLKGPHRQSQRSQWNECKSKIEFTANYTSSGKDVLLLNKLLGDMGYAGARAYIKTYGGKPHIILKGYPGLRKILTGTKYGVQHPTVVKIGLGKYGAIDAAKGGGILTIILLTGFRVIDYVLGDSMTLSQLVGTLATDIVKVGITTGASIAAAVGTSAVGTGLSSGAVTGMAGLISSTVVAIGPLVAVIAVGVVTTMLLTHLDEKYAITDRVIGALDELAEKGVKEIVERKRAVLAAGSKRVRQTTDSVIDYAVERAQRIFIRFLHDLADNLSRPRL